MDFKLIISLILGFLTGKYVKRKETVIFLGIVLGVLLGLLAGFEIAPLQYPFMISEINWVGIPEIRRVGLLFIHPDLILFQESVNFQSYSLILLSVTIVVSIIGSVLGTYLGIRYRTSDVSSPWAQGEQPG